jgi:tRNA threonylcarbamoyladenosine biosynthesis protein TsaE
MNKTEHIVNNNESWDGVVADLVARIQQGSRVITLSGDLGAGKTTLVQSIARELGVNQMVTSPTFVIMNIYPCNHPDFDMLIHIDAYRLEGESSDHIRALGIIPYLTQPRALVCIEWPEFLVEYLESISHIQLSIDLKGDNRLVSIVG